MPTMRLVVAGHDQMLAVPERIDKPMNEREKIRKEFEEICPTRLIWDGADWCAYSEWLESSLLSTRKQLIQQLRVNHALQNQLEKLTAELSEYKISVERAGYIDEATLPADEPKREVCETCSGRGFIIRQDVFDNIDIWEEDCPTCNGTGSQQKNDQEGEG